MGWLVGRVFKIRIFFLHEILMKYQEVFALASSRTG